MQDFKTGFIERLKSARLEVGFSQTGLARRIYVRRESVARWETGITIPTADNVALICKELDVSADWLLGLTKKKSTPNAATFKGAQE